MCGFFSACVPHEYLGPTEEHIRSPELELWMAVLGTEFEPSVRVTSTLNH